MLQYSYIIQAFKEVTKYKVYHGKCGIHGLITLQHRRKYQVGGI